jgi:hypothetical protein
VATSEENSAPWVIYGGDGKELERVAKYQSAQANVSLRNRRDGNGHYAVNLNTGKRIGRQP